MDTYIVVLSTQTKQENRRSEVSERDVSSLFCIRDVGEQTAAVQDKEMWGQLVRSSIMVSSAVYCCHLYLNPANIR